MKKTINPYSIIVALALILVGVILVILPHSISKSIGCSLIASGIVLFFTTIFIDYRKEYSIWNEWKLEKIFKARADKNKESDPKLEKHNIRQLDGICFGLKSFRSSRRNDMLASMHCGMNVRLLIMNPKGAFITQREKEENSFVGSISDSIESLVEWAKELNEQSTKGKIKIKYYNTMTLDFYWRMDDEMYIGPYMYNMESQQTITYKYIKGGRGFQLYSEYFESLWNDTNLCEEKI